MQTNQLIESISLILEEILKETDDLPNRITAFHTQRKPQISLPAYLQRIAKYTKCSAECYVLALIYVDLVQQKHQDVILNSYCVHRFLLASIMIAIKWHDDEYYKNEYYAKVGGISLQDMNAIEVELLNLLDYRIYVQCSTYDNYREKIMQYCQ